MLHRYICFNNFWFRRREKNTKQKQKGKEKRRKHKLFSSVAKTTSLLQAYCFGFFFPFFFTFFHNLAIALFCLFNK
jgi:hypothetical protein